MLISSSGTLVRTGVDQVSIVGRNTQGVRLMRLDEGERLAGVESIGSLGSDVELPEGELASLVAGEEGVPVAAPSAGDDGAPPTAH
jgi:DNA gyrase subunit A